LGFPLSAEMPFADGGRVQLFQKGEIYWWPDVGAIDLNEIVVRYVGLVCYGETDDDQLSSSDEPYVVLSVITPEGPGPTALGTLHEGVDAIEARPESVEIYRGKPLGLVISALLMEHDEDDPSKYKEAMRAAAAAGATALAGAIGLIPIVGAPLAVIAAPLLGAVAPTVADELHGLLDLGDDDLGSHNITLSAKQLIVHAARTQALDAYGISHKFETPSFTGQGATYKAYFDVSRA
jgi:hypothetical protein